MATYRPSNETELRTMIGYWDDSGGSRVAGTANAVGDIVELPASTITATGADRVLSLKPGVHLVGAGVDSSILSGFGFRLIGSGGASEASGIGRFTLDIDGLAAAAAGASSAFGGAVIEDASFASYQWKVTNSTPTAGGNNLTLVSTSGNSAVEGLLDSPTVTDSDLDCLSTKGGGATGNASTLYRVFNGTINEPGTAGNDQAVTPHEGVLVELYGGSIAGNSSGGNVAYAQAIDGDQRTDALLYNVTITGEVVATGAQLHGCLVNMATDDKLENPSVLRDTRIVATGTDTVDTLVFLNSNGGDLDIDRVDIQSGGSGSGLKEISGYTGSITANDLLVTDSYRGFDVRQSTGHTLTDSVLQATQYGVLAASSNVTLSNVKSDASTLGTPIGSVTTEDPLLAATISAKRDAVNVGGATQPAITDGWSGAVLAAYEVLQAGGGNLSFGLDFNLSSDLHRSLDIIPTPNYL